MSRVIKAVLIDPYKEEVTNIEYDASDYKNIYPLIHCDIFTVVRLGGDDDVLVDDEGLLKVNKDTKFFMLNDYPQPLAGYGLITGVDPEEGETISAHRDAEYYLRKTRFLDLAMIQVFGYFK
jgi:hypothetical protein